MHFKSGLAKSKLRCAQSTCRWKTGKVCGHSIFSREYEAGTKAGEAAMKANRFWWREQNKSLKQDCRLTLHVGYRVAIRAHVSLLIRILGE